MINFISINTFFHNSKSIKLSNENRVIKAQQTSNFIAIPIDLVLAPSNDIAFKIQLPKSSHSIDMAYCVYDPSCTTYSGIDIMICIDEIWPFTEHWICEQLQMILQLVLTAFSHVKPHCYLLIIYTVFFTESKFFSLSKAY